MKRAGPINGITINIISIKSRMNPKKNIISNTIIRVINLSSGISTKNLCMNSSPSKPLNTKENKIAPINIMKTILVNFIDSITHLSKTNFDRLF